MLQSLGSLRDPLTRASPPPPPPHTHTLQHLHEFLKVYQIPSDVKLSDPTWKQFFAEVVTRFKSARLHYYLADFLRQIGQKYRETKRPVDFLIDLLKLRVENLLSGEGAGGWRICCRVRGQGVENLVSGEGAGGGEFALR